ncbi:MAG: hypothetical protein ACJ76D_05695, partial [Solirubrobacterales bacterium]
GLLRLAGRGQVDAPGLASFCSNCIKFWSLSNQDLMQFTRWGRQRLPFFCSLCLWSDHKEQDEERLRAPDTGERCYLPTEDAAPRSVRRRHARAGVSPVPPS